jgi:hypothetical protein
VYPFGISKEFIVIPNFDDFVLMLELVSFLYILSGGARCIFLGVIIVEFSFFLTVVRIWSKVLPFQEILDDIFVYIITGYKKLSNVYSVV